MHGKRVNNIFSFLNERSLLKDYEISNCSFEDLHKKDNSFIVHQRNIHSFLRYLFYFEEDIDVASYADHNFMVLIRI